MSPSASERKEEKTVYHALMAKVTELLWFWLLYQFLNIRCGTTPVALSLLYFRRHKIPQTDTVSYYPHPQIIKRLTFVILDRRRRCTRYGNGGCISITQGIKAVLLIRVIKHKNAVGISANIQQPYWLKHNYNWFL